MMSSDFEVTASAGSLRPASHVGVEFQHRWTDDGVVVEAGFTGAHLLHLSIAGCVLNDIYREAEALGVVVAGVRVSARGDFDRDTWRSTGVEYEVEISSDSNAGDVAELLRVVDDVAEIPRALRAEATVRRV